MIGWHIGVYRLARGGAAPAEWEAEQGKRVAVWQAGLQGLDWLDALVTNGDAVKLGGDGYPYRYTAPLSSLIEPVRQGPPSANKAWIAGAGDIIDVSKWPGETTIDEDALTACEPDEWVMVEAWDES
jgi:hypothetical protein